jgi:hypothetical protein
MSTIYIGIDNGLSGGIVAIQGPSIIKSWTMPTRGKATGNEVDAEMLASFFDNWMRDEYSVVLETPGKFAKGVQAISSMWDSYGATRAVLECRGCRHHRIPPQRWQKVMIPNCAKGDTKPAALARARQLWPTMDWAATPRSVKPHEGLVDAALIAEYARILNL